ncbi:hypothetical protein TWF696_003055 [Orbilia brochopaga]|uniref:Uncharacterized protein n=1 Tax=Orbilia brochopaga TaxID=3140254 RepID=A0AAV9TZC8_9PEZI
MLNLTTVPPIPPTWTADPSCFTPSVAYGQLEAIYNVGCGLQSRRSCCPPGYNDSNVIFGLGTRGCPDGYTEDVKWGGSGAAVDLGGSEVHTLVCCPSGIRLWMTEGTTAAPLCYTQMPYSGSGTTSQKTISTFARPFFVAQATAGITTSASTAETGKTEVPSQQEGSVPSNGGLSGGAIAGIVVGVVLSLFLVGILVYTFCMRKSRASGKDRGLDRVEADTPHAMVNYNTGSSEMKLGPSHNLSNNRITTWADGVEMATMEEGGTLSKYTLENQVKWPTMCENVALEAANMNEEVPVSRA